MTKKNLPGDFKKVRWVDQFYTTEPTARISSNELCLLWKSAQFLREKCLYLKPSCIDCKKFQRVHPEPFLTSFQFFEGNFEDIV